MVRVIGSSMLIVPSLSRSTVFGMSVRPRAAEGRAVPLAPGDELEGARADLLPRAGDADDDALAQAVMGGGEGLAHHLAVADALPLKGDVGDAMRQVCGAGDAVGEGRPRP